MTAALAWDESCLYIGYRHSSPTLSGGWFHAGERHWPEYVLTDGP